MNGELVKPKKLKSGDKVRIIAPSSPFERKLLALGVKRLKGMGLNVTMRKDIYDKDGYLAGSDKRKVAEIHEAFADPETRAIFCARGGFGTTRLLYKLDYNLISSNPKIFVGFSDVTALNLAFINVCGFATFHGPVVASHKFNTMPRTFTDFYRKGLFSTEPLVYGKKLGVKVLEKGKAMGELIGGNLSILHSMVGLKFFPSLSGKIFFFEDIDEPPYKVERILCHLFQMRLFDGVKGVVVGRFGFKSGAQSPSEDKSLASVATKYFGPLRIPILFNFPAGHFKENALLPLGCKVLLNGDSGELVCEAGVSA